MGSRPAVPRRAHRADGVFAAGPRTITARARAAGDCGENRCDAGADRSRLVAAATRCCRNSEGGRHSACARQFVGGESAPRPSGMRRARSRFSTAAPSDLVAHALARPRCRAAAARSTLRQDPREAVRARAGRAPDGGFTQTIRRLCVGFQLVRCQWHGCCVAMAIRALGPAEFNLFEELVVLYTYYDYLDLPPGASAARIEAAYQTIKQRLDARTDETLVRLIHEAHALLSDPEQRHVYDAELERSAAEADAELKALLDEQARTPRTRRVQDVPTPLLAAIRAWAA